jgi:hypothetical protein
MERYIGWALILGLSYVAMTVYTEGIDEAFGGALAGMSRTTEAEAEAILGQTSAYTSDVPEGSTRKSVPITDAVRDRVVGHMNTAEERRRSADRY